MRLCNVASIFAVRPFDHNSLSALLRKVSITIKCKLLADTCQLIAYRTLFFSRWRLRRHTPAPPLSDDAEKVLGLRVAARTEHADQVLGGAPVAAPSFSKPTVALM